MEVIWGVHMDSTSSSITALERNDGDQKAPGLWKVKHMMGISTLAFPDPLVHSDLTTFKQLWTQSHCVGWYPYDCPSQDPLTCPALPVNAIPKNYFVFALLSLGTRKSYLLRYFLSSELFSLFLSLSHTCLTFNVMPSSHHEKSPVHMCILFTRSLSLILRVLYYRLSNHHGWIHIVISLLYTDFHEWLLNNMLLSSRD